MEVEVVRHHGGAKDAERQIEHLRVGHDFARRRETPDDVAPVGVGQCDLHDEAGCDHREESDNQRFDPAETEFLQVEDEEDVERRNEHADLERDTEDQVEADGGADDLGDVGGDDGDFSQSPQHVGHRFGECITACLCQITSGGYRQSRAKRLQDDCENVRDQRHHEQGVTELGAAS